MEIALFIWLMALGVTLHFWLAAQVFKAWHEVWLEIGEYAGAPSSSTDTLPSYTEVDWAYARSIGAAAHARLMAALGIPAS